MSNYIYRDGVPLREDELYHWKYIKREKMPNGKWRYIYKDTKLDKIDNEWKTYAYEVDRLKAIERANSKELDRLMSESIAIEKAGGKTNEQFDQARKTAIKRDNDLTMAISRAEKNAKTSAKAYFERSIRNDKTLGYKITELMNKSADKIDEGKNFISKLFSKKKKKQ